MSLKGEFMAEAMNTSLDAVARKERRAAYLAMAEECERRAATEVRWRAKTLRVDGHICLEDEMASEARENATRWLAAWARGRAGA